VILVPLAFGFVASSTAVFAAVWLLGNLIGLHGLPWELVAIPALTACAVIDLVFPRIRCSLVRRQTPERLQRSGSPRLAGLAWGLDTGSVISTFRASSASWAALLLVALGVGPAWAGLAYAAGFCIPLILVVVGHDRSSPATATRSRTLLPSTETASLVVWLAARGRALRILTAGSLVLAAAAVFVTPG
jgi:hypothetical protein